MAVDRSPPVQSKQLALVVLLENVGHLHGIPLPGWAMQTIDFVTEEYAKAILHLYGAYRHYDRVDMLEDAAATGPRLAAALLEASRTHTVDVLLLVHGRQGGLVGYRNREQIGAETFASLLESQRQDPNCLRLRMVYGLNCYGASLASTWLALGAQAVNGSPGVNWFPEPSLSVFLRHWLAGSPYATAVVASNMTASRWWRRLLKPPAAGGEHPWISSSQQAIFGVRDLTINDLPQRGAYTAWTT